MTNKGIKVLIISSAVLLLISFVLPFILMFSGSDTTSPHALPTPVTEGSPLSPLRGEDELRGLWIATVNNINFPSKTGLSQKALAKEIDEIVAFAKEEGFNAIMFQVRPSADALYHSELFPYSKFVSGQCGKAPDGNFDCLEYFVNAAHENEIALHAWVNPLRVTAGNEKYPQTDISILPESSPARQNPSLVLPYADGKLYFNPGEPRVRELVASGVSEICENYDIDGIIFDDYFYPYPTGNAEFDDKASFEKYGNEYASVGDFRRDNVNKLVKDCYTAVKAVDKNIKFGVSPFGIWQNSNGENGGSNTAGLEAYSAIYCDALAWARGGYVDYIAPQLYWSFDTKNAPFDTLCEWWSRALDGTGVTLYTNHGAYRYEEGETEEGELARQVEFARNMYSYRGAMFYGYKALEENSGGVLDDVRKVFEKNCVFFDYVDDGATLTIDSYKDNDIAGSTALIMGKSNLFYPITVNGITPKRLKDGRYSITLGLRSGDNLITVKNGKQKLEIVLKY